MKTASIRDLRRYNRRLVIVLTIAILLSVAGGVGIYASFQQYKLNLENAAKIARVSAERLAPVCRDGG